MRLIQLVAFVFLFVVACEVSSAEAPDASTPRRRKRLDERSVLVEWSDAEEENARDEEKDKANQKQQAQGEIDARVEEATKLVGDGKMEQGITILKQVLAAEPRHKRARFTLGTAFIQLSRYQDASDVLEPMLEEFPDDYTLRNNLAWMYATARDHSVRNGRHAVRLAQEALLIEPGDFHVWSTLSEAYYISGEYDKALRAAEEALELGTRAGLSFESAQEYRKQIEKAKRAANAMSILD